MFGRTFRRGLWGTACGVGLLLAPGALAQDADGIFADFDTSAGRFTVRLDYERAPRAVASFIGLATGEGSWLSPDGYAWSGPHNPRFYDDTLFYRVLTNLCIQAGAREGVSRSYIATNYGPAYVNNLYGTVVTTNPPGITTNDFETFEIVWTNAAGISVNDPSSAFDPETVLPVLTRHQLALYMYDLAADGQLGPCIYTSILLNETVTNYLPRETTRADSFRLLIPFHNPGSNALIATNVLRIYSHETNTLWNIASTTSRFVHAGYVMPDDADNGLLHSNGVISMANSGPNTDGSSFFLTATNVPGWDGSYTVFGNVTEGLDVIRQMASVDVNTNTLRPVEDIHLHTIAIRRLGQAASNFNIASCRIPRVEDAPITLSSLSNQTLCASILIPSNSSITYRISTNEMRSWRLEEWGYLTNALTLTNSIVIPSPPPRAFLHAAAVRYPGPWTAPDSVYGRHFTFSWTNTIPPTTYDAWFAADANSQGTFTQTNGTNSVSGQIFYGGWPVTWIPGAYGGVLTFSDNQHSHSYRIWMTPNETPRFRGTIAPWGAGVVYSISGTLDLHVTDP